MEEQMAQENERDTNSVFEQKWWLNIVHNGMVEEIIVTDENDNLCAKVRCCVKGKNVIMPILTQTNGIWVKEKKELDYNGNFEYKKEMISKVVKQISKYRSVNISLDSDNDYFLPFYWDNYVVSPKVSYRISELTNLDCVFNSFSKGIRRDIKSAQKKLQISTLASGEIMYDIMAKTFAEQDRKCPVTREIMDKVLEESQRHGAGKMLSAIDVEGNVHAAIFLLYDTERCYYLLGGKDPKYKASNALTLLIWEGIQFAAGVSKIFDFEGSMIKGIENYFRRFGPEQVIYYNVRKETLVDSLKNILKPYIKRFLGLR